jgi:hypothetical protein
VIPLEVWAIVVRGLFAACFRGSGKPMLYSRGGFAGVARQALDKLGVKWDPTEAERAYNEGRSTPEPVNPVVRVKGRFSRHLGSPNAVLELEGCEPEPEQEDPGAISSSAIRRCRKSASSRCQAWRTFQSSIHL